MVLRSQHSRCYTLEDTVLQLLDTSAAKTLAEVRAQSDLAWLHTAPNLQPSAPALAQPASPIT